MFNTEIRILSILLQDQISKNPELAKELNIKGYTKDTTKKKQLEKRIKKQS